MEHICQACHQIGHWRGALLVVNGLCYLCTLEAAGAPLKILDINTDSERCPLCGTQTADSEFPVNMLRMTVPNGDNVFYELPSWATDWIETRRCPKCEAIWEASNANY